MKRSRIKPYFFSAGDGAKSRGFQAFMHHTGSKNYPLIILPAILMLLALGMISLSGRGNGRLNFFQKIIYEASMPIQLSLTSGVNGIKSFWEEYILLMRVKKENILLKKKIAEMESLKSRLEEAIAENARLRELLHFREKMLLEMVAAEVIGEDASGWFKTVFIDKGRNDGVDKGMVVVTSEGIVGHIIESSAHSSKVLLITDRNSAVDAFIERSRARGIVKGLSNTACELKYLSSEADVRVGDRVISSGLDGIFPKGLLIGVVSEVEKKSYGIFQRVTIKPAVDFGHIEEVNIIIGGNEVRNA